VTNISNAVLGQIWTLIDKNHKQLNRNSFFKALYLIALVQQGKPIDERSLYASSTNDTLPKPILGELNDFRNQYIRIKRDLNPTCLGYNYNELCLLNTINLEKVPEKKGLIVKHIEYELTSLKHKTKVLRRYTDFSVLHELILQKYPYRIIPSLPPKNFLNMNKNFIEQRRKSLKRFLQIITRHPTLGECDLVKYFLIHEGNVS
jgi:sorting nexin-8